MADLDECYDLIIELVKQGGKVIRDNINKGKTIANKSCDVDLVTDTDKGVEKLLMDGISAKFSTHKFIGEETSSESNRRIELTDAPTWIIDPVDGTMNFVHSFPHTCVSVGLYVNKVPEIGVIYNPVLEQFFTARKGQGAFLNGKSIKATNETELEKALLMVEIGSRSDFQKLETSMKNLKTLTPIVHGTRALGSCALIMCMVAMGAADIMIEFGQSIWDVAAGDLIVREAGGVCLDPAGGPLDPMSRRVLCTSTPELAIKVIKNLTQYYPERH